MAKKSQHALEIMTAEITQCEKCPRLRKHCLKIAREKRKSFADQDYWGKPVPSFGDLDARILIVGLAPAAHGANRTGRMFTGDNSGLWLYRALAKAGFANEVGLHQDPQSAHRDDGLKLKDVRITAIARCAPPENKPTPEEIENCSVYLSSEISALKNLKGFVALGQLALKGLWKVLPEEWKPSKGLPAFGHGKSIQLENGMWILCTYHPSQQNTFTKKLTEPMLDSVFSEARKRLQSGTIVKKR